MRSTGRSWSLCQLIMISQLLKVQQCSRAQAGCLHAMAPCHSWKWLAAGTSLRPLVGGETAPCTAPTPSTVPTTPIGQELANGSCGGGACYAVDGIGLHHLTQRKKSPLAVSSGSYSISSYPTTKIRTRGTVSYRWRRSHSICCSAVLTQQ